MHGQRPFARSSLFLIHTPRPFSSPPAPSLFVSLLCIPPPRLYSSAAPPLPSPGLACARAVSWDGSRYSCELMTTRTSGLAAHVCGISRENSRTRACRYDVPVYGAFPPRGSNSHLIVPMHVLHARMRMRTLKQTFTRTVEDHTHSAGVKEKEVEERDTVLEKLQVLACYAAGGCPVIVLACK